MHHLQLISPAQLDAVVFAQRQPAAAPQAVLPFSTRKQMSSSSRLELLPDGALHVILKRLHLRDLAALCACSRAFRSLVAQQPEDVWRAAAAGDPAYTRHVDAACCVYQARVYEACCIYTAHWLNL